MNSREANLARLREGPVDVLILGGGINGAGIARDVALRNRRAGLDLRIALVEQRQFASGTSGKNSQLIHGGLRYLKGLEFGLVSEALRERAAVLAIAGPLAHPQPFLIPMYGQFARWFYGAGLAIYDALAGKRKLGRCRSLTREQVLELEPELARDGLTAGGVFFDAQINSARFALENVFDAARNGAIVVNYARAERVGPCAVRVHDSLSGSSFEAHTRKLVDATGPWTGETTGETIGEDSVRLVRGSHLVVPRLNRSANAIAYFEPSGRVVFVIPWGERGDLSLVGTTDVDHTTGPEHVRITEGEIRYLLGILQRLYPTSKDLRPIAAFSSLRPLVRDHSASPTKASRGHRIWNAADGVLHVSGGKYTTYRAMSEEAVDKIAREIAPQLLRIHETAATPLQVGAEERLDKSARIASAVEHEMAQRLTDLMCISTYWGYEARWTAETLQPYAAEMGALVGWDAPRIREEIDLTLEILSW
jgi:glycerol-3-phosphate dehydrogenase